MSGILGAPWADLLNQYATHLSRAPGCMNPHSCWERLSLPLVKLLIQLSNLHAQDLGVVRRLHERFSLQAKVPTTLHPSRRNGVFRDQLLTLEAVSTSYVEYGMF